MDCNTALGYIEPFLHNQMTDEEKEGFIKHINSCRDCRNELEYYFITYSVFDELDNGSETKNDSKKDSVNSLDYIAALDNMLKLSRKGLNRRRLIRHISVAVLVVIVLAAAAVLIFKI